MSVYDEAVLPAVSIEITPIFTLGTVCHTNHHVPAVAGEDVEQT
jgi:hypothetical protein